MKWEPIWILPNIHTKTSVDGTYFSIASTNDSRVLDICKTIDAFDKMINSFKNNFGSKISPSVILRRSDCPKRMKSVEAVASFRDCLSVATTTRALTIRTLFPNFRGAIFSSYFSIYPWNLSRDNVHIVAMTPYIMGFHDAKRLNGQMDPNLLSQNILDESDLDIVLFRKFMDQFDIHYGYNPQSWKNISLFRSLNMAHNAMLTPAGADMVVFDAGRVIGLWISAFEILVHPQHGRSGLKTVYKYLSDFKYNDHGLNRRAFKCNDGIRRNLTCKIYERINLQRNNFLHGNKINNNSLVFRPGGYYLSNTAAPLYRLLLSSILALAWNIEISADFNANDFAKYIVDRMEHQEAQNDAEQVIARCRHPRRD